MGVRRRPGRCSGSTRPTASTAPAAPGPSPATRVARLEFCENGAKAVAEEATLRRVDARVLRRPSGRPTSPARSDHWLGQQGRLTEPMRRAGRAPTATSRSRWDEAFDLIAGELRGLDSPDRGRLLHVGPHEQRGRVPLPAVRAARSARTTCPTARTCATSRAASPSPRRSASARARVTLDDIHARRPDLRRRPEPRHQPPADAHRARDGQAARRPHRRRQPAARGRADPVQEPADGPRARSAGARRSPTCSCRSGSAATSPCSSCSTGSCVDAPAAGRPRVRRRAHRRLRRAAPSTSRGARRRRRCWPRTGLDARRRRAAASTSSPARSASIVCWAMGLTQHRNAVATIREIVNFLLLRGNIGRPGAGVCPVRGPQQRAGRPHDGHLREAVAGVPRRASAPSSASSRPAQPGYDTVDAIRAMATAEVDVFVAHGRQLRRRRARHRRRPRRRCAAAGSPCRSSTKLNRSHVVRGRGGADPAVPRPHRARRPPARRQFVTVEDSMSVVHASRGLARAGVARPAAARWRSSAGWPDACSATDRRRRLGGASPPTTTAIRDHIERSCPASTLQRARPRARRLRAARTRRATADVPDGDRPGPLHGQPLRADRGAAGAAAAPDHPHPRPVQHDDLRPRRPLPRHPRRPPRRVRATPTTSPSSGFADGDVVDVVSEWHDGVERRAGRSASSPTRSPRGPARPTSPRPTCSCRSTAPPRAADTPTSKSVVVRLDPPNVR